MGKGSRAKAVVRDWRDTEDAPEVRLCEWPGCEECGDFRAPRSPQELREFRWFCLDHVRDYNAQWNYFSGRGEDEIEEIRRRDTVWHRPTWPLGTRPATEKPDAPRKLHDVFGLFGNNGPAPAPIDAPRDKALAEMDLDRNATIDDIKARYKTLVKKHHPDANGGSKEAEERFISINQAYTHLLSCEAA